MVIIVGEGQQFHMHVNRIYMFFLISKTWIIKCWLLF